MDNQTGRIWADLIISPGWIVTMTQPGNVLDGCSVVICDKKITAVLPTDEARLRYTTDNEHLLPDAVLMPGLVNTHGHAAMALLRGIADDIPLQIWLDKHIWPAEERWVSDEFVRDGTELAIAEMLLSGTTCFADMYFFPDQVAACMRRAGIRGEVAFPVLEFPSAWARDADEYIHKGLNLYDECKTDELINIAFGPHAPYTVADQTMHKVVALAGELDAAIQIHLHETAQEVDDAVAKDGRRPLTKLYEFGAISSLTQCVHMTQVNKADIDILQRTGAHVLHCPQSNMKLGSGFCPTQELLDAEINVALGTDGAASNNSLNLFAATNLAALMAKGRGGNAALVDAEQALHMATINGSKALGIEDKTGSISEGKAADLIAVEMSTIYSQPLYNPLSQLVYTDCARQVSHVWVNGRLLVANGQLQTLDQDEIINKAKYWQDKIGG
ncbi:MAG: TRZ/ATZ family hydrolase [Gammaproteobacteria bacterium]|nr:MAG: TRZ/ATZ family hydrolase [Gammaproteobacteria bacterium]